MRIRSNNHMHPSYSLGSRVWQTTNDISVCTSPRPLPHIQTTGSDTCDNRFSSRRRRCPSPDNKIAIIILCWSPGISRHAHSLSRSWNSVAKCRKGRKKASARRDSRAIASILCSPALSIMRLSYLTWLDKKVAKIDTTCAILRKQVQVETGCIITS